MMTPQFITSKSVDLAFFEVTRESKKLVFFIHGNSSSAKTWKRQYADPLFSNYRLIFLELPGHGQSGGSTDPLNDYTLPALGATMAEAINKLADGLPYIIIAASLGTNIIAEALKFNLHPKGLVLVGPCITGGKYKFENMVKPGTAVSVVLTDNAPLNQVEQYASEIILDSDPLIRQEFVNDYLKVKAQFRSSLAMSIQNNNYSNQIELVKSINVPVLIVFGREEKVIDPHYLNDSPFMLWNDEVIRLSNASHLAYIDQSKSFNLTVIEYLENHFNV